MTVRTMETHNISSGTVSICPVCDGPIFSAFANKTMYTNMAAHSICLLEPHLVTATSIDGKVTVVGTKLLRRSAGGNERARLALNDFIKEITI